MFGLQLVACSFVSSSISLSSSAMISSTRPLLGTLFRRACSSSSAYKPIKRPNRSAFVDQPAAAATQTGGSQPSDGTGKSTAPPAAMPPPPPLAARLQLRIEAAGPLTVAQYMREVLTNWSGGYYTTNKPVFGQQGDFITSPEIGQIFGELVAIWLYAEWQKCGSPRPLQLVELGPGRGTLMQDVIRVLSKLGLRDKDLSLHLVEVSEFLSEVQAQRLCLKSDLVKPPAASDSSQPHFRHGETVSGIPVRWYKRVEQVPQGFSVVLAHEFFDALPVHKFQQQDGSWREVMVDFDRAAGGFRLVAAKAETPALTVFRQQLGEGEKRTHVEHSFEMQQIVEHLARRLETDGGFGLVMDYGHAGEKTDTFRAFKKHQLHDPLVDPGTADLTADVDFAHMQRVCAADDRLITFGPVQQGTFLSRLGGSERLQRLIDSASTDEAKATLKSSYEMLTAADQMGERFKFFAMFPAVLREHLRRFPVNGFEESA